MPPPKFNKFTNTKAGKLKTIPKVASPVPVVTTAATPDENQQQFEVELCWCVQQLEKSLEKKDLPQKQVEDINKSIRILKSATQPTIKKRQLMRNSFGDYRSKMQEEERRMASTAGRVEFQNAAPSTAKSQFFRKAIIKPSGEDFRFNFKVEEMTLNEKESGTPATAELPKPASNTFHYQPSDNAFRFNFDNKV